MTDGAASGEHGRSVRAPSLPPPPHHQHRRRHRLVSPLSVIVRMAANLTSLHGRSTSLRPDTFLLCGGSPANDGRAARRRLSLCLPRKLQTHKHTHTCTRAHNLLASCVSNWANVFENAVQCLDELGSVCRVCSQRLPRINRGVNVSPATGVDICRHIQILAIACTGF